MIFPTVYLVTTVEYSRRDDENKAKEKIGDQLCAASTNRKMQLVFEAKKSEAGAETGNMIELECKRERESRKQHEENYIYAWSEKRRFSICLIHLYSREPAWLVIEYDPPEWRDLRQFPRMSSESLLYVGYTSMSAPLC